MVVGRLERSLSGILSLRKAWQLNSCCNTKRFFIGFTGKRSVWVHYWYTEATTTTKLHLLHKNFHCKTKSSFQPEVINTSHWKHLFNIAVFFKKLHYLIQHLAHVNINKTTIQTTAMKSDFTCRDTVLHSQSCCIWRTSRFIFQPE